MWLEIGLDPAGMQTQTSLNRLEDAILPFLGVQVDLRGVEQMAMSGNHSLALRHTGEMFSWGANEHGVLGLGKQGRLSARQPTRVPRTFFQQVGTSSSVSPALLWRTSRPFRTSSTAVECSLAVVSDGLRFAPQS